MGYENHEFGAAGEPEQGPSWQRPNWRFGESDALTGALDPTAMAVEIKAAAKAAGKPSSDADVTAAAGDSIRAMMLVRTYRVRGHLAANLDPLGLSKQDIPADLDPAYHGFTEADLDRPVYVGGVLGLDWTSVRELVAVLRANYCGSVGLEYMHIADVEERRFLQDRLEGKDAAIIV